MTVAPVPAEAAPPARTESSLAARLGAEAFGTFGLVLAIVGVALYDRFSNGSYVFPVAIAGGLGVAALIASVGHVSGGHFNPAVTFGLSLVGRAKWRDLVPYWIAQVVGGTAAAALLFATIPDTLVKALSEKSTRSLFAGTANGWADHSPLSGLSSGQAQFSLTAALLIEVVVTAVFVGVIIGVTDSRAKIKFAPIAIGFALFAAIIVAGPITNASVNPARSTASAIFSTGNIFTFKGVAGQLWLFWVAPLVGAGIAALFYLAFAAPRRSAALAEGSANPVGDAVAEAEEKLESAAGDLHAKADELRDKAADGEVTDLRDAANPSADDAAKGTDGTEGTDKPQV
ncbi:aquaporin [Luteimicrobium sp. DT211]|uniref:aquaporin n=1 Tax=Luteimicrobium sp. DT211 TaxID=3393412 RepID=UPI003CE7BC73